jgi:hypothetical protein
MAEQIAAFIGTGSDGLARAELVQWLQLEDRVARCQVVECLYRRSLCDREEALYFASEAVEIGFENGWTHARREFTHGVTTSAHRAGEHNFACRTGISHPGGIAAGGDKIAPRVEIERIDRQRDRLAAPPSPHFEYIEVPADQANRNEKNERSTKETFGGARPEISLSRVQGLALLL